MANGFFPAFLSAINTGDQSLDLTAGALKLVLVDVGYVYSASHEFLSSVSGTAIVAEYTLENVVESNGQISADDNTAAFPGLSGDDVEEALLVYDTTVDSTSRLILRWTTAGGLPLVPSGDDIGVQWSDGYVFRLGTATS